jgi:Flp pilus assembly protein TadB
VVGLFLILTFIGAALGALTTIFGVANAHGAPQEAAAAAIGIAMALIPYVLLRCAQIEAQRAHEKKLLEALEQVARWTKE